MERLRPPGNAERRIDPLEEQEATKHDLLRTLFPSAVQLIKDLSNPTLPAEEFIRQIQEYNQRRSVVQGEKPHAYSTLTVEVSPSRKIQIEFSKEGWIFFGWEDR